MPAMYIYNPAFYGYKRAVSAQDAAPGVWVGVPRCTANSANSTVNDAGELEVNGNREKAGCISALSPVTGTHHIALSYESTADSSQQTSIGVMEVWDQEEIIASTKLMSDQTSAVIEDRHV